MGIMVHLKEILPLSLYLTGLFFALLALGGNLTWALRLIVFLMPLRNVVEKLQEYPGGRV